MSTTRCDFCEMTLNSDLDVSRHLISQTHRDNLAKAIALHPCKETARDTPKNIAKVFESLKLRQVKDVKDLADKGYFRIPQESPDIVKVADQLVKVFLKCIAEHKTRNVSPRTRKMIMDSFDVVKVEKVSREQQQPRPQQQAATVAPESNFTTPQAPIIQPPGFLLSEPQSQATQASTPKATQPQAPLPKVPMPQTAQTRVPKLPAQPPKVSKPQTARTQAPMPQVPPSRAARPQTTPRVRPNIPAQTPRQQAPVAPEMNQQRLVRPLTRPTSLVPPPSQMPMVGAGFLPRPTRQDDAPPQPRPDSTYRPRLARIKIEPRDDQ